MEEFVNINDNLEPKETSTEAIPALDDATNEMVAYEESYSSVGDNMAESVLAFIAYAILIVGIIFSILIGWLLVTDDYEWDNKIGKIILIVGPIASVIIWATAMIIVNISNNVRQIKRELRKKRL